jgi:predicted ATPase
VARTLWLLGYPDQARQRNQEALTLVQELGHPFSVAFALTHAGLLHQHCREEQAVRERIEMLRFLSHEHGYVHRLAHGRMLQGWRLVERGQCAEGIAQIRQGMDTYRAARAELLRPYYLGLLAEAQGRGGQVGEGLNTLTEALGVVEGTGERMWEAELYRLKGELLLMSADKHSPETEACLRQALTIARRQEAKSLELRAAMSLCRLWQQQGKQAEARELLAPLYGWFTEGFDTADLREAKALLAALT